MLHRGREQSFGLSEGASSFSDLALLCVQWGPASS